MQHSYFRALLFYPLTIPLVAPTCFSCHCWKRVFNRSSNYFMRSIRKEGTAAIFICVFQSPFSEVLCLSGGESSVWDVAFPEVHWCKVALASSVVVPFDGSVIRIRGECCRRKYNISIEETCRGTKWQKQRSEIIKRGRDEDGRAKSWTCNKSPGHC